MSITFSIFTKPYKTTKLSRNLDVSTPKSISTRQSHVYTPLCKKNMVEYDYFNFADHLIQAQANERHLFLDNLKTEQSIKHFTSHAPVNMIAPKKKWIIDDRTYLIYVTDWKGENMDGVMDLIRNYRKVRLDGKVVKLKEPHLLILSSSRALESMMTPDELATFLDRVKIITDYAINI